MGRASAVSTAVFAVAVFVGGCFEKPSTNEKLPTVFTEHQFIKAAKPSKQLGESCAIGGQSDCVTDLCLHASAEPSPSAGGKYICSKRCQAEADCPGDGWDCKGILPGTEHQVCVPPSSWSPAAVAVRPPVAQVTK